MSAERPIMGVASALREAFDRSFAEPRAASAPHVENMIAIRVGTDAYAVSLSEVVSVHADHKIVAVPSPAPELLGLSGFRGAVVPVFDLRVLLGNECRSATRWLMLVHASDLVGLAFDVFEAHLRVDAADIIGIDTRASHGPSSHGPSSQSESPHGPYVRGSIRTLSGSCPILRVSSLLDALGSRLHLSSAAKDR